MSRGRAPGTGRPPPKGANVAFALASVVSAELRAGATDQIGRRAVLELVDQFDRLGRIVTPDARSWNLAGDVLGDIRRLEPGLRAKTSSLWNDVLIALSARQIGASIVTNNVKDFELLRRSVSTSSRSGASPPDL